MPTTSITFASAVQSLLPVVCGIPESALNGVSPKYVVRLVATLGTALINLSGTGQAQSWFDPHTGANEFTIYGFLQDKITLEASSEWGGITQGMPGSDDLFKLADTVTQAVAGRTLRSTLSTRRIWNGSAPISITMKLKFEAFSDPFREVIQPCMGLQGLTLPRDGLGNAVGLIPPGPNPFDISLNGEPENERGENISLNIGGFLHFDSVIVKSVRVTFENRMSVGSSMAVLSNFPSIGQGGF